MITQIHYFPPHPPHHTRRHLRAALPSFTDARWHCGTRHTMHICLRVRLSTFNNHFDFCFPHRFHSGPIHCMVELVVFIKKRDTMTRRACLSDFEGSTAE